MAGCRYVIWAAVVGVLGASLSTASAEPRAVVELFTSQGCSSCPPADKLLGDLTKDPTLIPLTLAIDIWDYLGWKDTLALASHTRRQASYSRMRGDRDVYTPQAVINGSVQALGSDRTAIERAIARSRGNGAALSLPLSLAIADGRLTVTAPAGRGEEAAAEVWLCGVSKSVEVSIGRGENGGHRYTYHNVVRHWTRLGVWNGKAKSWSIPVTEFKTTGIDAVAVIVQNGAVSEPGRILGAALASLDESGVATTAAKP